MILLVTGGSGCGKSVWAETVLHSLSPHHKIYLATMQAQDAESRARIERHRRQRQKKQYDTVECPVHIGSVSVPPDTSLLLEDVPNLLANEMFGDGMPDRIIPDILSLCAAATHLVIVTNDVFSDGFTYARETREYMRSLAHINQSLAGISDVVVEIVYSIPVFLKGHLTL